MLSNDWKIPLNLAIGVHIVVLLGGLYLPGIFKAKPKFADIYTVSIINIADPSPSPQTNNQPQAPQPVKAQVKPVKAKKIAPIEEVTKAVPPAPVKVKSVSLKPLKKKKIKKIKKQPPKPDYAKQRRQELAELIKREELLTEKARLANEALEKERALLQPRAPKPIAQPMVTPGSNTGGANQIGSSENKAHSLYYASVINRLHQFWALPESMQSNPDLLAVIVVTINKNGQIINSFFEEKSGDRVFDQFVMKTIEAANPMPPIPAAMRKQRLEIGFRFKPGGIQY